MRRSILGFDRVLVLLLGLLLIVVGVAAVGWQTGFLGSVWPDVPDEVAVDSGQVTEVVELRGPRRRRRRRPRRHRALVAPGAPAPTVCRVAAAAVRGAAGAAVVDPGPAVATAAEVLAEDPMIRSAKGAVLADRGELVVRLRATVDPDADLGAVVDACDGVLADLAHVLPTDQLRSRVELSVLRRGAVGPRVS